MSQFHPAFLLRVVRMGCLLSALPGFPAQESPSLYGIHDHEPAPTEFLEHVQRVAGPGWVTATVAVGHNPEDSGGVDFSSLAGAGHTIICRINNGYFPDGTIPLPAQYENFARRCAQFVAHSPGCGIWVIGNELNIAGEWPFDGNRFAYVSPQGYALCFRRVYDAIKAVRPEDKVLPAALAPWSGPFGTGTLNGFPRDANPLSWVQYLNQMLTAVAASGPLEGIALHVTSRGYAYADIHSTERRTVNGLPLSWSFYVYRDWIDFGIPRHLYHLPLYATECNGYYFWKGGHPENAAAHYEPGWVQEIYAEIDRHNQAAARSGLPVFHCVNLYRWCAHCDGWNIDGASNPYKAQILSDLDAAVARGYRWPPPSRAYTNLVAQGAVWSYLDDGSNQGTAWNQPAFADGLWPAGPAQLGYGDGDETTLIRSNRLDATRIITTYFRRKFVVSEPGLVTNLTLRLLRDDGAIVYLNGAEVYRNNMPAGPVGYLTPATNPVSGSDEDAFYSNAINPAGLLAGTNVLAVEVHQSGATSSDVSFDLALAAVARARPSVALVWPAADLTAAAPASFLLQAGAEDEDGEIQRVEFFLGRTFLGQALAPPWSLAWSNPPTGAYTLTAVARDNDGLAVTSAPVNLTFYEALVRTGDPWQYLDTGSNQGTAWRQTAFDPSSWFVGPGQLGYGEGDEATLVRFGPDSNNKYITTYFRRPFHVADPSRYTQLLLRLLRDDGALVFLNGIEVFRSNLPAGPVDYLTPASSAVGGDDEQRYFERRLGPLGLRAGANLVAVEVHQVNATSSDLSFDLELLGVPVAAAPRLTITSSDSTLLLRWPLAAQAYQLEAAENLSSAPSWQPVADPVLATNDFNQVTLSPAGSARFLRLHRFP